MLAANAPALAGLVRINPEVDVVAPGMGGRHTYEVNPDTGEYIICNGGGLVSCHLFSEAGALLATGQADHPGVNVLTIDSALAANGDFYLVVITQNTTNGARLPVLHGWDRNGVALMGLVVDGLLVVDASVAATEWGPWVGTGSFIDSPDRIQFTARHYNRNGSLAEAPHVFGPYAIPAGFTCATFDQESDIGANRAGDVAMIWLVPSSISHCNGTVMARTMRGGGFLSQERRLSTVVRDSGGHDVSPNRRPHASALEDGRFVVSWSDNLRSVTAVIGPTATILVPETPMMPGGAFTFAANPANGDYVAIAGTGSGATCFQAQLAIEAWMTPVTRFDVGQCAGVGAQAHQFLRDGELSVSRGYNGRITLSRVELPAQIEVNNVSVWEGNAGATTPAEATVTLTKPHPNGEDIQVSYFTRNGTAVAGQDFGFVRDVVAFSGATGETVKTATVPLLPDAIYEDDEHFTMEFELAQNAVIRRGEERADVLILDDDPTPPITPDCDPDPLDCRQVTESGPGTSVPVEILLQMAAPVGSDLQISYATVDGTALAGADYVARTGTVQIIAGSTAAAIPLTVLGDDVHEDPETFRLRLTAPAGVTLAEDDLVITINNDPVCFIEVDPPSIVAENTGGEEILAVTADAGCAWTASTSTPWISFTTPVSNSGNGSVTFQVEPFTVPGQFEREGSVSITLAEPAQSVVVRVLQDGDCDFTLGSASQAFAAAGGDAEFTVQPSDPRCAWEVLSPAPWITILQPSGPVSGNGLVRYRVDANAAQPDVVTAEREIRLLSEQFDHQVEQSGCDFPLSVDGVPLGNDPIPVVATGDEALVLDVDAPFGCHWTAVSQASWILVHDGASGNGEGEVTLDVLPTPLVADRGGSVRIGNTMAAVLQDGIACQHALGPATIPACPDGREFALQITADPGCAWTLHPDAPWVDVVKGATGNGDDDALGVIGVNLSETPRNATLQLRSQNIGVAETSVMQEGYLTYELFAVRPSDWSYQPETAWSVALGDLIGTAGQGSALALDASSNCSECEISARIALNTASSAPGEVLALLGWYRDTDDHVAFGMDEFSNRWTLAQVVGGVRHSVAADVDKIMPNTFYDVHLVFDGASFVVEVDGDLLISMPLQGDAPRGSAGLRVAAGTARITELRVNAIEADPNAPLPLRIFASRFEAGETPTSSGPNTSQCRLID